MNIVGQLEAEQSKKEVPALRPGETVRVHVKVVEGEKERTQVFEGIVIALSGGSNRAMFTVRKISYGVGVERIFPIHSPRIEKVEVMSRGKVRRAKLYYLRKLSGKAARLSGEEKRGG
jgi:large subunit ribosomal protein L19